MTMFEITFCFENSPDTVVITADPRESILEAARKANVAIDAPCSGNGSCGKCRVQILEGQIEGNRTQHISDEEFAAGWCLSCCCRAASDLKVLVPDIASAYKSRMKTADLSSGEEVAIFEELLQGVKAADISLGNGFEAIEVSMEAPTLDDTMPDNERLEWALEALLDDHTVSPTASPIIWSIRCSTCPMPMPWISSPPAALIPMPSPPTM